MKALITGANGQLGYALQQTIPDGVTGIALNRADLDLNDIASIDAVVLAHQPDIIINAAAYTAVDQAESDVANAYKINETSVAALAQVAAKLNAKMVHVSTDFVFDGRATSPYKPDDKTAPLGVYGASKLAGEQAVAKSIENAAIIRTAWVYSAHGNNFVKTMLRLMAEKEQLGVVADQRGTPTWANGLAQACWSAALVSESRGVYHYTDAGECSWYEFACEIQKQALALGLLSKAIPVNPISSAQYPTPAARPSYSVLDNTQIEAELGVQTQPWQRQLALMLQELK